MAVEIKVTSDPATGFATATVHMPGQPPLEVATLRGGLATGREVVEQWDRFLQFAVTKFLLANGQQIKAVSHKREDDVHPRPWRYDPEPTDSVCLGEPAIFDAEGGIVWCDNGRSSGSIEPGVAAIIVAAVNAFGQ